MELEPRTAAPAHATGAVEFVPLTLVADDPTFQLRDVGDVTALAASIGRLGQLVPVELRPLPGEPGAARYQVVAGFRRIAALRLLARERVLARVHATLDSDDAWAIALAQALMWEPLDAGELERLRARLAEERTALWADELFDEALARVPVRAEMRERFLAFLAEGREGRAAEASGAAGEPQPDAPMEVTPDELVEGLARRMFEVNQDLAVAFEAWTELSVEGRRIVVEQARYVAELYPHLLRRRR